MKLDTILHNIPYNILQGHLDKKISHISFHHEDVMKSDTIFVAIKGSNHDGHKFISQLHTKNINAIVVEEDIGEIEEHITVIKVNNTRKVLGQIAKNFYQHPDEKLNVIGITGTNGKTSVSYFLHKIFTLANFKTGKIGTNGIFINDEKINYTKTTATTPENRDLYEILHYMHNHDIDTCLIEVSSHALDFHRVVDVCFDTGLFINLSPEHLEQHKNLNQYFESKAKLFEQVNNYQIINVDDKFGKLLAERNKAKSKNIYTIGIHNKADIYATDIQYTLKKTTFTVHTPTYKMDVTVHFPGEVYVYNSLMAIATAYAYNIPKQIIQQGINDVTSIPGRFNIIYDKNNIQVIIDFAHTEEALKNLIQTVKPFVKGKLILVFGVYADMSPSGQEKRYNMGKVAGKYADYSVITLDNPKNFDQEIIINEIAEGTKSETDNFTTFFDREEAIRHAVEMSNENDMIIIAGKGHETTQLIGGEEIPINEKEIVLDSLKESVSYVHLD